MNKYTGRDESAQDQMANLYRRIGRIETSQGPVSYRLQTQAEHASPPLTVTSGSFTTLAYLWPEGARDSIEVYCRVQTPGGASMEIRLVTLGGGTVISPVATIAAGIDSYQGLRGRDALNLVGCELQARVASGAGTCRVGVIKAIGGNFSSELFS